MNRDYWCAATIRLYGVNSVQYTLWTQRIQAPTLSAARTEAIRMIARNGMEYGELQLLMDSMPAHIVPSDDVLDEPKR